MCSQDKAMSSVPMETGSEMSHTPSELHHFGWQQCVAVGGDKDESSQPKSEQTGRSAGPTAQAVATTQEVGPITSQQMGCCLQNLILVNNDTQCYLNASFLTVCWCHLQCKGFDSAQWPMIGEKLFQMIADGKTAPLELCSHSAMMPGLEQWCNFRGRGQQDLSEFLTFFLGWLHTKRVCQMTEKRVETDQGVEVTDKSGAYTPILLCSELWEDLEEPFPLQSVLQAWVQINGMHQALTHDSSLLCFQVCRFTHHEQ